MFWQVVVFLVSIEIDIWISKNPDDRETGKGNVLFCFLTLGMNQPTDSPGVRCNLIHSQQLCDYNYIHTLSDTDLVNIIMIININIINFKKIKIINKIQMIVMKPTRLSSELWARNSELLSLSRPSSRSLVLQKMFFLNILFIV